GPWESASEQKAHQGSGAGRLMVKVGRKQRWKSKHRQCRKRLSKMQVRWDAACSGNSRQLQSGPKPCWLLYKEELKEGIGSGRIPSSPALGCSRCPMPIAWRANPGAETTDWRARRGRTAQRVRREGMASAIPYPYPSTLSCRPRFPKADSHLTGKRSLNSLHYRRAPLLRASGY